MAWDDASLYMVYAFCGLYYLFLSWLPDILMRTTSFSGSVCADNGTEETREESKVEYETESEYDNDDVVEGESGDSWESESMPMTHSIFPHLFAKIRLALLICPTNWVLLLCPNWGNFWKC